MIGRGHDRATPETGDGPFDPLVVGSHIAGIEKRSGLLIHMSDHRLASQIGQRLAGETGRGIPGGNQCKEFHSRSFDCAAPQPPQKVDKGTNFGIQPRNAEQSFAFEVLNDPNIKLVGLTGKAGTGKTLLALASALKQAGTYKQILLARPIVALANKDLGFLPGDEKQKVAPYMQPLFDNLNVIKTQFAPGNPDVRKIDDMQKNNQLVIEALAFIRGRSLSETYCIIDEAQNLTPHEIKTIITRAGEGTKMVFTGDIQQIDSPYLDAQSNGLAYMIDKMKGQDLFAHINLIKGERSELSELASDLL